METYKVKQEDLIGEIKGLPIEIVQRMVDCQVEQGNKADVSVFQRNKYAGQLNNGFDRHKTKEGGCFWNAVFRENVDNFWKMYPKPNKKVYYRGDEKRGDEIIKALEKLGGQNSRYFNGTSKYFYYFISKNDVISVTSESDAVFLLQQFYTEAFLPEEPKETITIGNDTYEVTEELKSALKNLKKI